MHVHYKLSYHQYLCIHPIRNASDVSSAKIGSIVGFSSVILHHTIYHSHPIESIRIHCARSNCNQGSNLQTKKLVMLKINIQGSDLWLLCGFLTARSVLFGRFFQLSFSSKQVAENSSLFINKSLNPKYTHLKRKLSFINASVEWQVYNS